MFNLRFAFISASAVLKQQKAKWGNGDQAVLEISLARARKFFVCLSNLVGYLLCFILEFAVRIFC